MRTACLSLLVVACTSTVAERAAPPDAEESPQLDPLPPSTIAEPHPPEFGCVALRGLPRWGAYLDDQRLRVRARSGSATRMVVEIYDRPRFAEPIASFVLEQAGESFTLEVSLDQIPNSAPIYYGLRAWGPNWPFDPAWTPGSDAGFIAHVDAAGDRFNPNKLLIDPYALELSHDPIDAEWSDYSVFNTRDGNHTKDSGPYAPKGIALRSELLPCWERPSIPLADSIIYEVHVRGFTMQDPSVPEEWRGTYRGAAEKAQYLASLGVTAIELLPIHETPNDQNDLTEQAEGDNYWGYSSLSFFAPDRRYSSDRSPGGPTRELREMVRAFHRAGIEVYLDVVYNHTAESGILSWRGLDNRSYYELSTDGQGYANHTGVGPNLNTVSPIARDLVIDSLRYYRDELGIDGFRFDLAAVLGNRCERSCFSFDPHDSQGILQRAVELDVDLIAEPWGIGAGTYQLGNFPQGWAEWNGLFRDTIRRDQNALGVEQVPLRELARRLLGSSDLFHDDGRSEAAAINYVVSHDGFTLRDLYSYSSKVNDRPWPYGPSSGGEDHNLSWDHGGDPEAQRQAARTGLVLLMIAAGAPMITGGDEMYRTQFGNNNPYNLDSPAIWLDWSEADRHPDFLSFARFLMMLRRAHPELRSGEAELLTDQGTAASSGYLDDPTRHFLGVLRGDTYVAYNGWQDVVRAHLPDPGQGEAWRRVVDTAAWFESEENHRAIDDAPAIEGRIYDLQGRSAAIFIREETQ